MFISLPVYFALYARSYPVYTRSGLSLERREEDKEPKLVRNNFQHEPNEVKTEQMKESSPPFYFTVNISVMIVAQKRHVALKVQIIKY